MLFVLHWMAIFKDCHQFRFLQLLRNCAPLEQEMNIYRCIHSIDPHFVEGLSSNTYACDKPLHHVLQRAAPSVWGNPTEMCVSGNAGVQSSQDNMEEFKRLI